MKLAIIGCGSIGRRHAANFLALGHQVAAWNRGATRRDAIAHDLGVEVFDDLEAMLQTSGSDAAVVCSPNNLHMEHALAAARAGLHLFIEKPLSHTLDGIDELIDEANKQNLITHVGANMRFNFGLQTIKKYIDDGRLGRVLRAGFWAGMNLPSWHPDEDYRQMYSAHEAMGGGAVLDFIHEIDSALWMFGTPDRVAAMASNSGWLDIETEDTVDAIFGYDHGPQINLHMDYLETPFRRGVHVLGDKGRMMWDLESGGIDFYDYASNKTKFIPEPEGYEKNHMYLAQSRYFADCVERGQESSSNLDAGKAAMQAAIRIKQSSAQQRFT